MAKGNFVSDMISDLRSFKQLLIQNMGSYITNINALDSAISQIKSPNKEFWSYNVPRLEFKELDLGKVVCPDLHEDFIRNAVLELTIKFACRSGIPDPIEDPITDYGVQIQIKIRDLDNVVVKSFWRFELHPTKVNGKSAKQPEFHHPLYHLHFGGHELNNDNHTLNQSNVLILEAPRIMHPPMDIVLAIDFVLNNFYSFHECKPFIKLKNNPLYDKIVKNARERFWKPFALGFASNFATNHSFGTIREISVAPTFAKNLLTYSEKH
jgi:hypothetical protein